MKEKAIGSARVLEFLRDRKFHTLAEIEQECGVEGRSRLSDLRRQGHVLERHKNEGASGKAKYSHRLVQTAFERSLEEESLAELEPVPELDAGSSSASDERSWQHQGDTRANGDSPAEGERIPPSAGPAVDEQDAGDTGWRDLFPAESAGEALPPPSAQLELGVGS